MHADVFVDDSPENVTELRAAGIYTICFGNSTNAHVAEPRTEGWSDVYRLIKERYPRAKVGTP